VGAEADGARRPVADLDFAPVVPNPDKIVCAGLNYRSHILEMGRELPEHPTLFAKYRGALIGANDEITLPAVSDQVDWEAELAVVIGARARHVSIDDAPRAIAGYAVLNDISVRDYQNRTLQWLQGKTFEGTTPVGPWLVTADESPGPDREISCEVDGELMQRSDTAELVFPPAALVAYLSSIVTLEPGDIIATGTTGGWAWPARHPASWPTGRPSSPASPASASCATSAARSGSADAAAARDRRPAADPGREEGALTGPLRRAVALWSQTRRTLWAWSPLGPWVTSNSTA
jgi:acylpyruvate hydrolase